MLIDWRTGHVERTNDRDYEIEERYGYPFFSGWCDMLMGADGIGRWRRLRIGCRRRRRGILILCEVGSLDLGICGWIGWS